MKTAYTFIVLRYVHDILAGEFANLGVVLYAPRAQFLGAAFTSTYGRLSKFFGEVEGERLKTQMRHIQAGIEQLAENLRGRLPFDKLSDVKFCVSQVLPPDDSSFQFSPSGAGTTSNPQQTLEDLYERYVERYSKRPERPSRTDEEVWPVFRKVLAEHRVLSHLRPKKIVGRDYEHEFPYAWKNGLWHTCEAISFDLLEPSSIIEKANTWVGRAVNLQESEEKFKVYLLLGKPKDEKLKLAFTHAKNILNKMPVQKELFSEDEAHRFADLVEKDIREHLG